MRKDPTEFRNRFLRWKNGENPYSAGRIVDAIYKNNPKEEFLGEPSHNYDFTQSEEWANAHGYYPDERGHRDDRVKKPAHPSHPSRGSWDRDKFVLTDKGMLDPNYTLFGLNDGGLDPLAILTHKGSTVLPEITVTPKGNYIYNSYDNIKLHLPKHANGKLPKYGDGTIPYTSSDGSSYNINPNVVGSKLLNITVPEVVVTGNDKRPMYQRYDAYNSTYDSENVIKGFNTLTLGGLNNLSPTQWARRMYDFPKVVAGPMRFSTYVDRWINGNEGVVSSNFEKNHPYLSMGINGGIDVLTGAAANKLQQLRNLSNLRGGFTTGIPNIPDSLTGVKLPELFKKGYTGTVWASDQPDYGRYFAYRPLENAKLFDIYTPKSLDLLETPKAPEGSYFVWNKLPFTAKRGKISISKNAKLDENKSFYKTKERAFAHRNEYGNIQYDENPDLIHPILDLKHHDNLITKNINHLTTDRIVNYSKKLNKDGVIFHDVYDGGLEDVSGNIYDIPINEIVLNPGAEYYFLEHGMNKLKLFNQMPYKNILPYTTAGATSGGLNKITE